VTVDAGPASAWLVEENDYGDPMVQHHHSNGDAVAYVLMGRNGGSYAQCAECGARHILPSDAAAAEELSSTEPSPDDEA
jgi:hypothetical protein